jgi:hypothetical protein
MAYLRYVEEKIYFPSKMWVYIIIWRRGVERQKRGVSHKLLLGFVTHLIHKGFSMIRKKCYRVLCLTITSHTSLTLSSSISTSELKYFARFNFFHG